jgi:hypothetical protein
MVVPAFSVLLVMEVLQMDSQFLFPVLSYFQTRVEQRPRSNPPDLGAKSEGEDRHSD